MDLLNPCDQCDRFTTNAKPKDGHRLCSACLDNLAFVNSTPIDDLRVIASSGVQ